MIESAFLQKLPFLSRNLHFLWRRVYPRAKTKPLLPGRWNAEKKLLLECINILKVKRGQWISQFDCAKNISRIRKDKKQETKRQFRILKELQVYQMNKAWAMASPSTKISNMPDLSVSLTWIMLNDHTKKIPLDRLIYSSAKGCQWEVHFSNWSR